MSVEPNVNKNDNNCENISYSENSEVSSNGEKSSVSITGSGDLEENGRDEMERKILVRKRFVKKVFTMVAAMFAIVSLFAAFPMMFPDFLTFCRVHWQLYYASTSLFFIIYFLFYGIQQIRRKYPINIIILMIFTFSAAFMIMFSIAFYDVRSVFIALLISSICSATIVFFAFVTEKDLTTITGLVYIIGVCTAVFSCVAFFFVFFFRWYLPFLIYTIIGTFLSMLYLAIDLQWIVGGRSQECPPNDWIFASLSSFLDSLYIFFFILSFLGWRSR
ncbi:unnamed protein product [Caenorhabditis angaria]|uniref:Uncharacterized protein n=1 Tax=Caenorhabditis angaria TaxID=860376 RepID=A0A9P1N9B2_9PELO|nr:unnamed protein product [Caenorhabditis angaria]